MGPDVGEQGCFVINKTIDCPVISNIDAVTTFVRRLQAVIVELWIQGVGTKSSIRLAN